MGKKTFILFVLISILLLNCQVIVCNSAYPKIDAQKAFYAKQFLRTELYFGTDKNDGTQVTNDEWNKFLADEVTPKFPDGFTVLQGFGQFRRRFDGKIVREESKVLILLYPMKDRISANRKIEQIRTNYKKAFRQQSVLRVDFPQAIRVSF